jgi:hypothetical protein
VFHRARYGFTTGAFKPTSISFHILREITRYFAKEYQYWYSFAKYRVISRNIWKLIEVGLKAPVVNPYRARWNTIFRERISIYRRYNRGFKKVAHFQKPNWNYGARPCMFFFFVLSRGNPNNNRDGGAWCPKSSIHYVELLILKLPQTLWNCRASGRVSRL